MKSAAIDDLKLSKWIGICINCGKGKDTVKFGSGKAGECNACAKIRWNSQNSVKVRAQRLYGNAHKRSKANNWPAPDFSSSFIEEKILNGFCEVTGIPFDLDTKKSSSHTKSPWVPSLDRIDNSKPYSKDNIQLVVFMYNVCKSEFRHEDVVKFCRSVALMEAEVG